MNLTLTTLIEKLKKPLPGIDSHLKMAPPARKSELEDAKKSVHSAKKSAVMILLYHEADNLKIVFIRRSFYVGIHAGQIAFPGGRFEDSDTTIENTAFREIDEEIGIKREDIELLGRISDIYVPPSNFLISVFVGYLHKKPIYNPDPREVAEVIEIDFNDFLRPECIVTKIFEVQSAQKTVVAPCYETTQCDIWGASAMVLAELIAIFTSKE